MEPEALRNISQQTIFLRCGVVSASLNPQPVGPTPGRVMPWWQDPLTIILHCWLLTGYST